MNKTPNNDLENAPFFGALTSNVVLIKANMKRKTQKALIIGNKKNLTDITVIKLEN